MTWRCSLCKHLRRTFEHERDVWRHIRSTHTTRREEARPVPTEDGEEALRA